MWASFQQIVGKCPLEWNAFTQQEFILSVADGSLPRESLISYMQQDYIFLTQFARSFTHTSLKRRDMLSR